MYQLIDKRVTQWSPGQKSFITPAHVYNKFGIPSHNFCVARSFCGDPSDGIPGIKGAGFKTLSKRFPVLVGENEVSVEDIIEQSRLEAQKSKVKIFQRIVDDSDMAKRNWKLMYLDSGCLSSSQIEKIENSIDTFSPCRNKIALMKVMIREGLSSFDADSFYMTLNSMLIP